jgi:hypothetical protein
MNIGFAMPRLACVAASLLAAAPLRADFSGSVAVAAEADQGYARSRLGESGPVPIGETYVVAEGRHFGGSLGDGSAEKAQFGEVVKALAPILAKQRYYPAAEKKDARFLIVVHWGETEVADDTTKGALDFSRFQNDMGVYNGQLKTAGPIADPSRMNSDLDVLDGKSTGPDASAGYNAQLLGFAPELKKQEYLSLGTPSGMTETDRRIREELEDPRYFVILMAYEVGRPAGGGKPVKPRLLWSIHYSTRALGTDFSTALGPMSEVAAGYFGRNVDGLVLDAAANPAPRGAAD